MTVPFIHDRYKLPDVVDYRKSAGNNKDQLTSNACTGFATMSIAECFLKQHAGIDRVFSPRHNYYYSRIESGNFPQDGGSQGWAAVKIAEERGMADEKDCPFHPHLLNVEPAANLPTTKAKFVSLKWDWRLGQDSKISEMKYMLAEGMMLTVSAKLMWTWGDENYMGTQGQTPSYYHQIAIVGYDQRGFIVENSYGGSDFLVMPYRCAEDLYAIYGITQVGDVKVTMSDPDLLYNALKPYYGKPAEFQEFMRGIAATSPNWMTFNRYLMRHGNTAESALAFCKLLGFDHVSKLAAWVDKT